jgi:hypothetical protein
VSVFPAVATTREEVEGRESIIVPTLAPGQQLTLSNMYAPPITASQINMPISSDEVMASQINVLLTRQPPRWWVVTSWLLLGLGAAAALYALLLLFGWGAAL